LTTATSRFRQLDAESARWQRVTNAAGHRPTKQVPANTMGIRSDSSSRSILRDPHANAETTNFQPMNSTSNRNSLKDIRRSGSRLNVGVKPPLFLIGCAALLVATETGFAQENPLAIKLTGDVAMEFVRIPAGTFTLGQENSRDDERCRKATSSISPPGASTASKTPAQKC
jgi:hypothetical protein